MNSRTVRCVKWANNTARNAHVMIYALIGILFEKRYQPQLGHAMCYNLSGCVKWAKGNNTQLGLVMCYNLFGVRVSQKYSCILMFCATVWSVCHVGAEILRSLVLSWVTPCLSVLEKK